MDIPELPPRVVILWAKQSVVIPQNHIGVIEVKSDYESLDLYVKAQVRDDRCFPNCIITTDPQGNARIPIVNYSASDVLVKENEKISRAVLCTEVQTTNYNIPAPDIDVESIKHGDQLTDDERQMLIELIMKYKDCDNKYEGIRHGTRYRM